MRKRTNVVYVRFTDDEYEMLLSNVKKSGQTIQSYVLDATLNGHITSESELENMRSKANTLNDIDKQLRGIGTNINQLAHKANGYGEIPQTETLKELLAEIVGLRKEVDYEWQLTRQSISRQRHMEQ